MAMHFCTSDAAEQFASPARFPPHMLIRSTIPAVNKGICDASAKITRTLYMQYIRGCTQVVCHSDDIGHR